MSLCTSVYVKALSFTLNRHTPPISRPLSKQVGSRPSSKQALMLVRPEIPAPITATFWTILEMKHSWHQRELWSDVEVGTGVRRKVEEEMLLLFCGVTWSSCLYVDCMTLSQPFVNYGLIQSREINLVWDRWVLNKIKVCILKNNAPICTLFSRKKCWINLSETRLTQV